jgi:hypothetical protein
MLGGWYRNQPSWLLQNSRKNLKKNTVAILRLLTLMIRLECSLLTHFLDSKSRKRGDKEAEEDRKFDSIVVQDKHNPEQYYSIFGQSLPLQLLSQKNINIIRFYVTRDKKGKRQYGVTNSLPKFKRKLKKLRRDGRNET